MNDITPKAELLQQAAALGVTRQVAADAAQLGYLDLSADARELVRQGVLDTLGVAIAGATSYAGPEERQCGEVVETIAGMRGRAP